MTAYLVDVNLLLALSWPGHQFHELAQTWFARNARKGWATCPMVEAGFVRVLSNPAFSARAVSPKEALDALKFNTKHSAHRFWADELPVVEALANLQPRVVGHQQITDAYLLALALHHRGKLATLDKGIGAWAGGAAVEVIG
jgi:toxin-antitoxin system PIN domain toxin